MGALGLDDTLLSIIVCPECRGSLRVEESASELVCEGSCGFAYPVQDGIPVLLVDEARKPE
jgi:hypothetical protein